MSRNIVNLPVATHRTVRQDDPARIALLGAFELRRAGSLQRLPRKAQAMLTYLVLHAGKPIPRDQLATLLWGNSGSEQARQSLRQSLVALRSALGPDASQALVAETSSVALAPTTTWAADVAAFETACRSSSLADLEVADALYRGELLAGMQIPVEAFNDWLSLERQRLAALRSALLLRLSNELAGRGEPERAIASARTLTLHDPLQEEGHRLLMRLLAQSGNRNAALKHHEHLAATLRQELGVQPDAETARLIEAIRAGEIGAGAPAPSKPITKASTEHPIVESRQRYASSAPARPGPAPLPLPDKPSIVVLPFANLSGDPSQDYLVDGLVEDITMALGREKWLFVIASPSAFAFRNSDADPLEIATALGVRYVLRGSVRKSATRVRISVQLSDAFSGAFIWSHRFEDEIDNIFAMHDRLMTHVAAMIAPALRSTEIDRVQRKAPESLNAFELYLQALPLFRTNLADSHRALRLLDQAIALDPSYSVAYAFAARCYQFQKLMGWISPIDPRLQEGTRLAHVAAELGKDDSEALWMTGMALVHLTAEVDHARALIDRSLSLNPSSANALSASCMVRALQGDYDQAIENFHKSQRLNPLDQLHHVHWNMVSTAYFGAGRYEEADAAADKALNVRPTYPQALRLKIATCGLFGRVAEARVHVERLLKVHPACSIAWVRTVWEPPMRRTPQHFAKFMESLRLGGLPEGDLQRL